MNEGGLEWAAPLTHLVQPLSPPPLPPLIYAIGAQPRAAPQTDPQWLPSERKDPSLAGGEVTQRPRPHPATASLSPAHSLGETPEAQAGLEQGLLPLGADPAQTPCWPVLCPSVLLLSHSQWVQKGAPPGHHWLP